MLVTNYLERQNSADADRTKGAVEDIIICVGSHCVFQMVYSVYAKMWIEPGKRR